MKFEKNSIQPLFNSIIPYAHSWHRGVVVITTAQLYSTNPELRFCGGSNSARGVLDIRDGEDFRRLSSVNYTTKTIHHHHHHNHVLYTSNLEQSFISAT